MCVLPADPGGKQLGLLQEQKPSVWKFQSTPKSLPVCNQFPQFNTIPRPVVEHLGMFFCPRNMQKVRQSEASVNRFVSPLFSTCFRPLGTRGLCKQPRSLLSRLSSRVIYLEFMEIYHSWDHSRNTEEGAADSEGGW